MSEIRPSSDLRNKYKEISSICKEKKKPVAVGSEVVVRKQLTFGLVSDERFCDGLYFARSLKKFKRFMANPSLLETPLEAKIEDDD